MCHPEIPPGQPVPEVRTQEVTIPVGTGEEMPAHVALPESGRGPGVLVVHDVYGRSPFYENVASRLAQAGFRAVLPELFFRLGSIPERTQEHAMARRARMDEHQALDDLASAVDWLRGPAGAGATGTVGFCMGGTFVLDLAARKGDLATVCFYGFPAAPANRRPAAAPAPLELVGEIEGPILAFWGDQDTAVGLDNVERLVQGLEARGVELEHKIYPGLGHGFMAASGLDPALPAYEAACDAWTRTIEFCRARLAPAA